MFYEVLIKQHFDTVIYEQNRSVLPPRGFNNQYGESIKKMEVYDFTPSKLLISVHTLTKNDFNASIGIQFRDDDNIIANTENLGTISKGVGIVVNSEPKYIWSYLIKGMTEKYIFRVDYS
jgi:hypothetical protein